LVLIEIDGAYGEGGGQILRNAVAFSVLTNKPVKVRNIRANRPIPGIRPQHLTVVRCMKELSDAEVKGLSIDSSTLIFKPKDLQSGEYDFDVGTAGSITLVFQACILCSLDAKKPIIIKLKGGTDVRWSPSWDYLKYVFMPLIKKIGMNAKLKLLRRGYYPRGGGEAILTIKPTRDLNPLKLISKQDFKRVNGNIHVACLPDHIGGRIKKSVEKILWEHGLEPNINLERTSASLSQGVVVTLWSESMKTVLGSTLLGEKGVSSEKVGVNVARNLLDEICSGATVDVYAADQILPYVALSKGSSSFFVRSLSSHAMTNVWLIKHFFNDFMFESTLLNAGVVRVDIKKDKVRLKR
jgi:RNA 3'-phosphate cyclase